MIEDRKVYISQFTDGDFMVSVEGRKYCPVTRSSINRLNNLVILKGIHDSLYVHIMPYMSLWVSFPAKLSN
jgi:hypothetical protein